MVADLIQKCFEKKRAFRKDAPPARQPVMAPAEDFARGVPTLKGTAYKKASPMLTERFRMLGRWTNATHGHWLGIADMEAIRQPEITDPVLQVVKEQQVSAEENWPNEASALFRADRLSLFAGSDLGNEKIYLLWIDCAEEPEVWVYDANGESRYKDLSLYLEAYLADDVSAANAGRQ